MPSPEHPMGHANKRAQLQHHWRFGHGPRMPGYSTAATLKFLDCRLVSRSRTALTTGCSGRSTARPAAEPERYAN